MTTQILPGVGDASFHYAAMRTTVSPYSTRPFCHKPNKSIDSPMATNLQSKTVTTVNAGKNGTTFNLRESKHPRYQTQQSRLDSYVGWPARFVPKTPEELSSAGFFYIGSADRVTCFQCGITLRDWEVEHDPVTEHRRYAQSCQFIQQVVVELEARTHIGAQEGISSASTCSVITISDRIEQLDLNSGEKLLSLSSDQSGCSEPDIVEEVFSNTDPKADVCASIAQPDINDASTASCHVDPVSNVESINTSETKPQKRKLTKKMASLQAENKRLKEESVCRMCKHKQVSILFLPCGHLVTCPGCAESVVDCIKCGKNILGTVRTYRG